MKAFSAQTRQRMSESAKRRCTPEWRAHKSATQSAQLDKVLVTMMYEKGRTQREIACALGVTQKIVWRFMKNNNIPTRTPAKRFQFGEQNDSWKGENAKYGSFHARVAARRGKAKDYGCSVCGANDKGKDYDWANLTGDYNNTDDYAPMCRKCHRRYDLGRQVMKNA